MALHPTDSDTSEPAVAHPHTATQNAKGKKVTVWFGGNEYNLLATLAKYNLNDDTGVTPVQQPFDMNLLQKEVDSAAMTYNEPYQVLSAGQTIDELNIIYFNAIKTPAEETACMRRIWEMATKQESRR